MTNLLKLTQIEFCLPPSSTLESGLADLFTQKKSLLDIFLNKYLLLRGLKPFLIITVEMSSFVRLSETAIIVNKSMNRKFLKILSVKSF